MPRIATAAPLAHITLRRYEKPFQMERQELVRKLCLSLGLLQPGDSRDIIVDIFSVLLDAKEPISVEEITTRITPPSQTRHRTIKHPQATQAPQ
ncbi:hypothetical protein HY641_00775 [Candidatus Woesearchaeota archaeon]|nr:hypothetical protein [Candidatus Woesearchaeota archaeon]